jgi:methanogenic corrinoid protein MtbC1
MAMLMLSRMMESRGWQTVFLGVGPPLPDLEEAVEHYKPDVVAASLTIPGHWNSLEIYIRSLLPRMKQGARMIIGGAGLAHFRNEVESMGILVADDLDEAVSLADQIRESGKEESQTGI